MTAIIVARITPKDPEKMKAYGAAAAPTVADHGGVFMLRGKRVETLLGMTHHKRLRSFNFRHPMLPKAGSHRLNTKPCKSCAMSPPR